MRNQGNVAHTYKFGLLYCGDKQMTEEEIYGNKQGSDGFEDFLDLLGERVQLAGFQKFKGGLDTQSRHLVRVYLTVTPICMQIS